MGRWEAMLIISIVLVGCKKPYNPPAIASPGSYLVVEGEINSGADSTFIKLSRTVNLSSKITTNPELHAVLAIQSDQNVSYPLKETSNGNYACAGLNLDNSHTYRLSIKTANNEQYLSDYVPVLNSPPIDSISYDTKGNANGPGLNIYSNTHDPKNSVIYYRWDYQETWIFHSDYVSSYVSNGDTVLGRNQGQQVYECWGGDSSSSIIIGTTAKLLKSVINNNPITFVNSTSEKLGTKYSIQVRQYALTADAYNFYVNLKKNTEQLGSIFDAQPSQISGNIHSTTNPSEPVIGYISVGNTSSKRIFITLQQLPDWLPTQAYPIASCPIDTERFLYFQPNDPFGIPQEDEYFNYNKKDFTGILLIPIDFVGNGHTGSYPECVDCTLRGTNKQPGFWK